MIHDAIGYFIPTIPNLAWFMAFFGGIIVYLDGFGKTPPTARS